MLRSKKCKNKLLCIQYRNRFLQNSYVHSFAEIVYKFVAQ